MKIYSHLMSNHMLTSTMTLANLLSQSRQTLLVLGLSSLRWVEKTDNS